MRGCTGTLMSPDFTPLYLSGCFDLKEHLPASLSVDALT